MKIYKFIYLSLLSLSFLSCAYQVPKGTVLGKGVEEDKKVLAPLLSSRGDDLLKCYNEGLLKTKMSEEERRVGAKFHISLNKQGQVAGQSVVLSTKLNWPNLDKCLLKEMAKTKFPPSERPLTIIYELVFNQKEVYKIEIR